MGFNQQLFDFGLTQRDLDDIEIVRAKIQEIDRNFKLIMINEKMDESLVLLADLLCLPLYVVATIKLNARKKHTEVMKL